MFVVLSFSLYVLLQEIYGKPKTSFTCEVAVEVVIDGFLFVVHWSPSVVLFRRGGTSRSKGVSSRRMGGPFLYYILGITLFLLLSSDSGLRTGSVPRFLQYWGFSYFSRREFSLSS